MPSPDATDVMPAMPDPEATYEDVGAPSRAELLKRAAELGPSRMTWESIVLQPTDPILKDKMQPRVQQRRARLRLVVQVALGACLAFCLVVAGVSTFSSMNGDDGSAASVRKTAPAVGTVLVEKLEMTTRAKASAGHFTAAARPVPVPAGRGWGLKRR